jgi:uncharacterized phage-associated protein
MVCVFDIAKYILDVKRKEISTMHLQKLHYHCQASYLVWHGTPLFPEDFERWDNRPVCKELFDMHRRWFVIEEEHIRRKLLIDKKLGEININTIEQVMDDDGTFNSAQLGNLAHKEKSLTNAEK